MNEIFMLETELHRFQLGCETFPFGGRYEGYGKVSSIMERLAPAGEMAMVQWFDVEFEKSKLVLELNGRYVLCVERRKDAT